LDTKTLMLGGSTRMIKAEGTCTISASRSTISCHLWAISEGIWVELPNTIDLIEWPAADGTGSLRPKCSPPDLEATNVISAEPKRRAKYRTLPSHRCAPF